AGAGSGVVLTADGFILTSAHVVAGPGRGGRASFVDGTESRFRVIGSDPFSDLAVLRAEADSLAAAELGDAESLRVGQLVIAVGPRPLPPQARGRYGRRSAVEVVEVVEQSPASRAGLRAEDLLLEVDGLPIERVEDLQRLLTAERIGRRVSLTLLREG